MNLLLDTQIALWAITGDPKLGRTALALIEDGAGDVFVSVISISEIAIKHKLQRGSANDMPIPGRIAQLSFEQSGFRILPVLAAHAAAIDNLPALHGDPFDRMLVAQALIEPMRLVTRDARLAAYGAMVLLA